MSNDTLLRADPAADLRKGAETAFIDLHSDSNLAYKPEFVVNSYREGQKVLSVIERELSSCDSFAISVAFITRSGSKGKPYLETHHVVWLSKGGSDAVDNTVALCPNCHRKMHIVNSPSDVSKLKIVAKNNAL